MTDPEEGSGGVSSVQPPLSPKLFHFMGNSGKIREMEFEPQSKNPGSAPLE